MNDKVKSAIKENNRLVALGHARRQAGSAGLDAEDLRRKEEEQDAVWGEVFASLTPDEVREFFFGPRRRSPAVSVWGRAERDERIEQGCRFQSNRSK